MLLLLSEEDAEEAMVGEITTMGQWYELDHFLTNCLENDSDWGDRYFKIFHMQIRISIINCLLAKN